MRHKQSVSSTLATFLGSFSTKSLLFDIVGKFLEFRENMKIFRFRAVDFLNPVVLVSSVTVSFNRVVHTTKLQKSEVHHERHV